VTPHHGIINLGTKRKQKIKSIVALISSYINGA